MLYSSSFTAVVLILKILLQQTNLDKPFTGGLGSYKLYVLVAHHVDRHISLGGEDTLAEVLISFFYRFGDVSRYKNNSINRGAFTKLSQRTILFSDGGEADLSPVFKIDECAKLFGLCFMRLMERIKLRSEGENVSFLSAFIDTTWLRTERNLRHRKSELLSTFATSEPKASDLCHDPMNATAGTKRVGHVVCKSSDCISQVVKVPTGDDKTYIESEPYNIIKNHA